MARQLRIVDLQYQAAIDDRLVFVMQRLGESAAKFLVGLVVLVAVPVGEVGRGDRRHEGLRASDLGERGLQIVDVALQRFTPAIGDWAGADPLGWGRPSGRSR